MKDRPEYSKHTLYAPPSFSMMVDGNMCIHRDNEGEAMNIVDEMQP